MNYALHEALRVVQEEGLEARFQRHQHNHAALVAGLTALGLELAAQERHRLWTLTSVRIPPRSTTRRCAVSSWRTTTLKLVRAWGHGVARCGGSG